MLDVGSSSIKLGHGGEDGPRLVYPSVIDCCCPFNCCRHMDISVKNPQHII